MKARVYYTLCYNFIGADRISDLQQIRIAAHNIGSAVQMLENRAKLQGYLVDIKSCIKNDRSQKIEFKSV